MRVGGVDLRPGDAFDTARCSLRTHKLLFAQRKIDEVGGVWHKISGLPPPSVKTEFAPPDVSDPPFAVGETAPETVTPKAKRGRTKKLATA